MEDLIRQNWSQLLTLIGIIWGYATLNAKVNEHTQEIDVIQRQLEEMSPIWSEIKERLASIEATLAYIVKDKNK
jgi:Holliday junction resolvase-like predicted endonuclease